MNSDAPSLTVDVIGDSGPFSEIGKSIGYRVKANDSQFLVDCGAPVFQLLGPRGLAELDGIIATHAHEDHKRWFTDIALHQKFTRESDEKTHLLGSKQVLKDYRRASLSALERTLSPDCRRIVHFSYDDYVETTQISPQPKYSLQRTPSGDKESAWRVLDDEDNVVPKNQARVFVEEGKSQPRFLIKDPKHGRWVEPASYYGFDDGRFYQTESFSPYHHPCGLKITPIKATAWHGPPTTSLLFEFKGERIFFSTDTMYNPSLWNQLSEPVQANKTPEDHDSYVLHEDINDYNEQTWSKERLQRANSFYDEDLIMIHDVSGPWAVVHTDYRYLEDLANPLLLTHSPDVFTSIHPITHLGKSFAIENNEIQELTEYGQRFPLNADCYYKQFSDYYVGYNNSEGNHALVRKGPGQFKIKKYENSDLSENGVYQLISRIDLYEEIGGDYFPVIETENEKYVRRPDGQVEKVHYGNQGSRGVVVDGLRKTLTASSERPSP